MATAAPYKVSHYASTIRYIHIRPAGSSAVDHLLYGTQPYCLRCLAHALRGVCKAKRVSSFVSSLFQTTSDCLASSEARTTRGSSRHHSRGVSTCVLWNGCKKKRRASSALQTSTAHRSCRYVRRSRLSRVIRYKCYPHRAEQSTESLCPCLCLVPSAESQRWHTRPTHECETLAHSPNRKTAREMDILTRPPASPPPRRLARTYGCRCTVSPSEHSRPPSPRTRDHERPRGPTLAVITHAHGTDTVENYVYFSFGGVDYLSRI